MCHEYFGRARDWDRDTEEADDDDLPSFLNEEGGEDVEVLTDGGDDE